MNIFDKLMIYKDIRYMSNSLEFAYFKIPLTVSELRWSFYFEDETSDIINDVLIENPDSTYYILKEGSNYDGYCSDPDFEWSNIRIFPHILKIKLNSNRPYKVIFEYNLMTPLN